MPETPRRQAMGRYRIRFGVAMAIYSVLIVTCLSVLKQVTPIWGKVLLALLPVVPIAMALREILLMVRSLDELEQRVQAEAVVVAAVAVCMITFAWGLIEKAGLPRMPVVLVLPLFCAIYGVATWRASCRYR